MKHFMGYLCIVFLISGCGIFKSEPTITPIIPLDSLSTPHQPGNLKFIDCPFETPDEIPPELIPDMQCASLSVPENRQIIDGPKIDMAVAIVKTKSEHPKPDPVLVLIGNPNYGLSMVYFISMLFENIIAHRDMVIIDQRGTGYSRPSYNCAQINSLSYGVNSNLSLQEFYKQYIEATSSCVASIKSPGVDLSAYTTRAVAADLEDLRQALKIRQWNILTFFDGSQVALTMMRDYPHGIRSVILDSAVPLHANQAADWGKNASSAIDQILHRCSEDEKCRRSYPDLAQTLNNLLEQLDQQPLQIDISKRYTGERSKVTLDSELFISLLLRVLSNISDRESLPEVPHMINQLGEGNTEVAAKLLARSSDTLLRSVMDEWLICNEEFSFVTLEQVDQANAQLAKPIRKYFNTLVEGQLKVCDLWEASGVSEIEKQPVGSSIPTLLLTGEFNWSEPPAWSDEIAQTLRNSTVVEFSGTGRAVYASGNWLECSHNLVDTFLDAPDSRLETGCSTLPADILWITLP